MRFVELAMLALPFVVFVAWRLLAPTASPPRVLVIAVVGTVATMAVVLLLLWYKEAAPPTALYVPAQLENGRIVPSQVESVTPRRAVASTPPPAETGSPGSAQPPTPDPQPQGAGAK